MKFKVWDKVRVTREWLAKQADSSFVKSYEVSWWTIKKIAGDGIYCPNKEYWYEEEYLELVPEESKFKRWETVEVYSDYSWKREKRIFICEIPWIINPYVCVDILSSERFKKGEEVPVVHRKKIRKLKPTLTRKEVAEKFWVSEDFVLVN